MSKAMRLNLNYKYYSPISIHFLDQDSLGTSQNHLSDQPKMLHKRRSQKKEK